MASAAHRISTVFDELCVTDSACEHPYIPTCLAARAVKRATGHQPPPATLRRFLDEDVEQSPMRRLTRQLFEQLCRLVSATEKAETAAEARSAARQVFGKKESMSASELRVELLRTSETDSALTEREVNHILEEVSKFTSSSQQDDNGVVSVSDMERYLLAAASEKDGSEAKNGSGGSSTSVTNSSVTLPKKKEEGCAAETKRSADGQTLEGAGLSDVGTRSVPTNSSHDTPPAAAQQRQAAPVIVAEQPAHSAPSPAPPHDQRATMPVTASRAPPEPGHAHPLGPRTHPKMHDQKCCTIA